MGDPVLGQARGAVTREPWGALLGNSLWGGAMGGRVGPCTSEAARWLQHPLASQQFEQPRPSITGLFSTVGRVPVPLGPCRGGCVSPVLESPSWPGPALLAPASSRCLSPADWQVSQHLQQASRVHEAESSRLSQQVSTKGATLAQMARELEQARRELGQAREELEQMQLEMNGTQEKLRQWEAALEGTKEELARVQEEKREIKEKLNQTKSALASIRPCEQTDCCPADWVLYRGKCLFISKEKTNWEESRKECEQKSAQLLIAKSWDTETTPVRYMHGRCDRSRNTVTPLPAPSNSPCQLYRVPCLGSPGFVPWCSHYSPVYSPGAVPHPPVPVFIPMGFVES
uniref:Uncharacterized protein n=1 Tax=Gopherus evgoodei TaxID=1825980 RepID=A0A8C4WQY4_9SAUR